MRLDAALIQGAVIFHSDTTQELLVPLRYVRRCNDSTVPSQFVAINTGFDTNHDNKEDSRPIVRLIGLCYTTPTGQVIMVSVDPKQVDEMNVCCLFWARSVWLPLILHKIRLPWIGQASS